MHIPIAFIVLAVLIWLAIEQPKFRKALFITCGVFAVLIAAAAALLMSKP
jgi:hypothetical protein